VTREGSMSWPGLQQEEVISILVSIFWFRNRSKKTNLVLMDRTKSGLILFQWIKNLMNIWLFRERLQRLLSSNRILKHPKCTRCNRFEHKTFGSSRFRINITDMTFFLTLCWEWWFNTSYVLKSLARATGNYFLPIEY
jgi:hypothetical protein